MEFVLISVAIVALIVGMAALVGRLGDLDDLSAVRDMVDRS
jgi:hypothetical protein